MSKGQTKISDDFKNVNSKPENIKLTKGTYTLKLGLNESSKYKDTDNKKIQLMVDNKIKNIKINWQKYDSKKSEYVVNFTILQNPIILTTIIIALSASGVFASGAWFFSEINKTASYLTLILIIGVIVFNKQIINYGKKFFKAKK